MKKIKIIEYALLVLSFIVFIVAFLNIKTVDSPMLNVYLGWTYALIAIAVVAALGFPLVKAFGNKKSLRNLLILIVGAVVLVGGVYLLAPGNIIEVNKTVEAGTFKFSDAALILTYIFLGAAIVSLIWSVVHQAVGKNKFQK